jgi:MFS family permease
VSQADEQAEGVGEAVAAEVILQARAGSGRDWTAASIYTLAILTLISTLNYFDRSVLALVLPLIKAEFKVSDTTLGAVSSLILFYAVFGVPIAWLAERWSRRNVIAIGLAFWSLMTALTSLSASIWQLGMFRFFMGVGEGCGLAPSQSLLSDVFSRAKRPLVLAVITTASSISLILFSPVAGWIAQHHGWRATFLAAGIPGLAVAAVFALTVKEPRRKGPAAAESAPLHETVRFLLGSRAYLLCLLGTALMGVYLYGVGTWGVTFLTRVRHLSIQEVGGVIQPIRGVVAASGIVLGGLLVSRLELRDERWRCWLPGLACLILAPCEFLYTFAGPLPLWASAMIAANLFSIMHQGPIYAAYVSVARPRMRAVSVSVALLAATLVGQLGGPILIGRLNDVLNAAYGQLAIRYSMLVVQGCCVLAGLCFLAASAFIVQDTRRAADV